MRILRIFGIVLISAVVAAAITTIVLVVRRPDQVGRGPIASGGSTTGSLAAVQRAQPSVVRIIRSRPAPTATATASRPGSPGPTTAAEQVAPTAGTGVIIDPRGYVLTAEALIAGADAITVAVPGGRTVAARVVGSDPEDGLSLLRIDEANLKALPMGGAAALETGSGVVLLSAAGFPQVAVGAVASAHSSVLMGDPATPGATRFLNDLAALDVASREGQLGAPILDAAGRLAGMVVRSGVQLFAADLTQAQPLVQQLLDSGHVSVPSLGFTYRQLSVSDAADLDLPGGVRVLTVEPAAAARGLAAGDVVVSANGTALDPTHPLALLLRGLPVRQAVSLSVRAADQAAGSQRRAISLEVQLSNP
ncbi:MAG: trypsin-like peptidase domain-containing protein [Candidatus Dormibacteria bacterium]